MNYLFNPSYVAFFGTATVAFLWLRDARIFYRTGLSGYRTAAYKGVLFTALAILGCGITILFESVNLIGLGIILLALYMQGGIEKEKIWKNESLIERLFGKVPLNKK